MDRRRSATDVAGATRRLPAPCPAGVPNCAVQQQAQYGRAPAAQCGQLVITAANGKQSIDTVTVTIGGKAPTSSRQHAAHAVRPGSSRGDRRRRSGRPDHRAPGRLQRNVAHVEAGPAARCRSCLQRHQREHPARGQAGSLAPAGQLPVRPGAQWPALHRPTGTNPYDPTGTFSCPATGWNYFTAAPNNPQVDRLPLEGILGWDATVNGNLAQLLQEPTLMGAYEGAGITVLSKGVNVPDAGCDGRLR